MQKERSALVAQLARNQAGYGLTIFNDRKTNGDRSIKVPRWKKENYEQFAELLTCWGFKGTISQLEVWDSWSGKRRVHYRIHVSDVTAAA